MKARRFLIALVLTSMSGVLVPSAASAHAGFLSDLPVWFRLWIDHTGLVRRAEMRAQGHFMDQTYSAFDRGFEIRPPRGAA